VKLLYLTWSIKTSGSTLCTRLLSTHGMRVGKAILNHVQQDSDCYFIQILANLDNASCE